MNGSQLSLGIDGGASSAKWSLLNEKQEVLKQGSLSPIDGHLYRADSKQRFQSFLASVKSDLADAIPNVVSLGITGLGAPEELKKEIIKVFPASKIELRSDIALAYHSEFTPGEGIYLYAGTGSVAIHISQQNVEISVGGWGYLLGDEGAGYWIGREAIRHLLSQIESSQTLDFLSTAIAQELGGANWSAIRSFVYGKDRSAIAALAPIVTAEAKDKVTSAQHILESAAHHLYELVIRMRKVLNNEQLPISFGGGIANTEISDLLEKKLGVSAQFKNQENNHNHSITAAKLGLKLLKFSYDHP